MTTDKLVRTLSYRLLPSSELTTFNTLSDVYYLCDEGYHIGKRFTGALIGMYAYGGTEELTAVFKAPAYISQ